MPSLAAAPERPYTRPRVSAKTDSISFFSWLASFSESGSLAGLAGSDRWESQLSSIEKVSVSQRITDLSITFCSSRMLPGQG